MRLSVREHAFGKSLQSYLPEHVLKSWIKLKGVAADNASVCRWPL